MPRNAQSVEFHFMNFARAGDWVGITDTESQTELIRLRRQMKEVVEQEDYEKASQIRDQIRRIESEGSACE